ncbi:MAG: hypothetical protein RBR24_06200 [Candidatus Carbobacillus sp.]|nr:hypothetical protein [Candidatus Carbobacillus sp.]
MNPLITWVRTQWVPFDLSNETRHQMGSNDLKAEDHLELAVLAHMHRLTQGAGSLWTSRRILLTQMVERWYQSLKQAHRSYRNVLEKPSVYPSEVQVILHYHTYFQHLGQTVLYYLQDHYDQTSYRDMRPFTTVVYDRMPKDWFNVEALPNGHIPLNHPEQWTIDLPVRDLAGWVKHRLEDRGYGVSEWSPQGSDELEADRLFEAIRSYHALRPLTPKEGPYFYALLVFPEAYIERVGDLSHTLAEDPSVLPRLLEQEKRRGRIIGRLRRLVEALYHHDIEPITWFESS